MKIYVVGSSKNKFLPLDNIREKFLIDQKHEGDNIDFMNPWFCELTGLYYLWKHCDDDIVGLEHYRRYFVNNKGNLLSEIEIKDMLKENDVLYVKCNYSLRTPPKTWLIKNHKWHEMQKFLMFIKCYVGQEYFNVCERHLNGDWHALGNMFIAKKNVIHEYSEFMYDLMFTYIEAEKHYGRTLPPRIIGYLAEFLFGAWLVYHQKKCKEVQVKFVR